MAPRKPKNPIQDIINTTSAWLGGNRGTINPQVARVSRDLGTVAQTIDTFTGGLGAAALRDARNFQQGGSLPTNVAKTAAVNLAAGAVGAKAAQVAGRAVAQSGIVPRAARAVTGRNTAYFVHGSPTTGIKKLDPIYETMPDKIASEPWFEDRWPDGIADPSNAGIYGWPITRGAGEKGSANLLTGPYPSPLPSSSAAKKSVREAIEDSYGYSDNYTDGGSLYIAKAPRSSVGGDSEEIISSPAKVIKEIRTAGKSADQVAKEAEAALKKLGFKYPKSRGGGKNKK